MLIRWYSAYTLIIPGNNSFAICSVRSKQAGQFSWQLHADIPKKYIQNDAPWTAFLFPVLKTDRQREMKEMRNGRTNLKEIHQARQEKKNNERNKER